MTDDDDKFFGRLRGDASALRYQPDEATLARIRARIHARVARPGVLELLVMWFRPLAATLTAVALAAAIGVNAIDRTGDPSLPVDESIEISIAGDTYSVGR